MQEHFDRILSSLDLPSLGVERGVVAVSGGRDSMTLLSLLLGSSLVREGRLEVGVAHCNFHLRGKESDCDEALVREFCSGRNIPLDVGSFDTLSHAWESGESIEMAARSLRYSFFEKVCTRRGAALFVAHSALDNAETLLLNLVRGTGLRGLCGMKSLSTLPVEGSKVTLIRPLLSFSREEITLYAQREKIPFRDDRTNDEPLFRRNRIRHDVIPVLESLNPSFLWTASREMENFSQAFISAEENRTRVLSTLIGEDEVDPLSLIRIDRRSLLDNPSWKYVLHDILEKYGFSSAQCEEIFSRIPAWAVGRRFISPCSTLCFASESLLIGPTALFEPSEGEILVEGPGTYSLPDGRSLVVGSIPWSGGSPVPLPGTILMDRARCALPLRCRPWKDGDRMRPLGMGGRSKLLSDMFVDMGLDAVSKRSALVLEDADGEVVSLFPYRVGEKVRISSGTTEVLSFTLA